MRIAIASVICCASAAFLSAGCTVGVRGPEVEVETPSVEIEAPLIEGPGVDVVVDEPAIEQRQYVYEVGYPPGVYLYGGFYYYGGHRYERDVFITRVVEVNKREHKYVDVEKNRQVGAKIVEKHRVEYKKTGGHRAPPRQPERSAKPEQHREVAKPEHHEVAKPEHHEVAKPEHHEVVKPEHETVKPEHHEVVKPAEHGRPPEKPVNGKERKPEEEKK